MFPPISIPAPIVRSRDRIFRFPSEPDASALRSLLYATNLAVYDLHIGPRSTKRLHLPPNVAWMSTESRHGLHVKRNPPIEKRNEEGQTAASSLGIYAAIGKQNLCVKGAESDHLESHRKADATDQTHWKMMATANNTKHGLK